MTVTTGCTHVPHSVWSLGLAPGTIATLVCLLGYVRRNGRCDPSIPLLAKRLNCSENTVRVHIDTLISQKIISVTIRPSHTNVYRIDTDLLPVAANMLSYTTR